MALDSIARGFSFTAASSEGLPLPFKGGEACRVIVDNVPVLTGFIESVIVTSDGSSHDIEISGRSTTGDVVDSSLIALEINTPISLQKIIEAVVAFLGINIQVFDDSGGIEDFNTAEDKVGPAVGENAFAFIERLARKRQVLLTCDADANIVITRSKPELIEVKLQNLINDDGNNIMRSTATYDNTDRFQGYIVKSQLDTSSLIFGGDTDLLSVVDQGGIATDIDVRFGRLLTIKAEKSSSVEQCKERATWEANIHRTRSRKYTVTVSGFQTSEGELWTTNKLVQITDVFADIDTLMLINTIGFSSSLADGSITTLGFVDKDSYLVEISEPDPVDNVGNNLFGGV